ncbi:hypothetical protein [Nocardioides sp.]|uniref:hypothetical protein n=1 Tax=Nocardioides sp. TaxID=35761 RepID=UPI002EDAC271
MKRLISGLAISAGAAVLTGCGATPAQEASAPPAADGLTVTVSRTHIYTSIRDLAGDVATIAVVDVVPGTANAVPADGDGKSPIPASTVSITMVNALRGSLPSPATVRLITSPVGDSEVPPALEEGHRYLLFLSQFEWEPGVPTGEWTVPGGAGIYEISKDDGSLSLLSRGEDAVPTRFASVAAARQALGG